MRLYRARARLQLYPHSHTIDRYEGRQGAQHVRSAPVCCFITFMPSKVYRLKSGTREDYQYH